MNRALSLLLSSKGLPVDDTIAALWGKKIFDANQWQITTLTGTLPLSFLSKGEALTDYLLHGTSEGAGVETSGTEPAGYKIPLTVTSGVTENLWDEDDFWDNGHRFINNPILFGYAYSVPSGTYTVSTNVIDNADASIASIFAVAGRPDLDPSISSSNDGVFVNRPRTVTVSGNQVLWIVIRVAVSPPQDHLIWNKETFSNYWIMLNAGSTALPYIPHRYTSDYPLYIGDSKLGAEEYVSYAEQKVYKDVSHPSIVRVSAYVNIVDNGNGSWTLNHLPYVTATYEDVRIGNVLPLNKLSRLYYIIDVRSTTSFGVRVCARKTATGTIMVQNKYLSPGTYSDYIDVTPTEDMFFSIVFNSTISGEGYDVTIHDMKICTPTDPPAPFPAITAHKGENTLSSTETLGECSVTGRIKPIET